MKLIVCCLKRRYKKVVVNLRGIKSSLLWETNSAKKKTENFKDNAPIHTIVRLKVLACILRRRIYHMMYQSACLNLPYKVYLLFFGQNISCVRRKIFVLSIFAQTLSRHFCLQFAISHRAIFFAYFGPHRKLKFLLAKIYYDCRIDFSNE